MDDFLIDEVAIHYNASKNREYRSRVITRFGVFIGFLQKQGLTTRELLGSEESPTVATRIMRSDLTDEGYAMVKDAYDKWLKANNAAQATFDTTLLENSLNQIRRGLGNSL